MLKLNAALNSLDILQVKIEQNLKLSFLNVSQRSQPGYLLMAFDANNEEGGPIGFFSGIDPAKGQYLDCFNLTRVIGFIHSIHEFNEISTSPYLTFWNM